MAIQLNPAPVDVPYPYYPTGYTHLMIRGMVMNACGFVDRITGARQLSEILLIPTGCRQLGTLRAEIITRLGIGTVPTIKTDTLANIQADLFNMLGMAAMVANPPPGIASMITSFINEAQQMIFNAIEMDQGANSHPPTLVNGTDVTVFDRTAVTTLALGLGKAHYGQEDAQIYMQESAKYLKDFADRQPVNIKNIVNAAIVDAQRNILAQYVTMANPATVLAGGVAGAMNVKPMVADTDYTSIAAQPVFLLALANLKAYYKQPDAQMAMDEFKLYMADMPPNTWNLVGQMVTMAQEKLYRQYNVFRNERWWTWTLNQGQTFYGIANDDDAVIPTPTGVTATIGATSTAPALLYQSTGHTCTVLQNGKVLIAGGYVNGAASPIAQLYDPSTGITSQLPNMAVGRFNHAAVLLSNGNVLLCGSQGPKDADSLASAEIFNTSTNTFGLVGSMAHGRFAHTATLLSNGDVLVSGGATITSSGTPEIYQSCEIFSNSLMQFTSTGSMATARFAHTADVLPDGTVMVIGGHDTTTTYTLTCEIYSSSTGAFTAGASLATARAFHSTVVTQESLYVIGGETTALAAVATIEQYSSVARAFSTTATLVTARSRAACRLADSNKIVITGGYTAATTQTATTEILNTDAGTLSAGVTFPQTVGVIQSAKLQDGTIFYCGGYNQISGSISNEYIYYPVAGTFAPPAQLAAGTDYYRVAFFDNQGHYTLPSVEVSVASVPANTPVVLNWTYPPNGSIAGAAIFGRTHLGEQLLATVDKYTTTWIDYGTIVPNGAMPTFNTTGTIDVGQTHPILDQRKITWAGVSNGDNIWRPLIKGVPPTQYHVPMAGVPAYYDVREAIEIWPPPAGSAWKMRIKGQYQLAPFVAPTDTATIDYQAIYLQATADVKAFYKQPDAEHFMLSTREYVGNLVAGQHTTQRYIPTQHSDYIAPTIPVALPPVT